MLLVQKLSSASRPIELWPGTTGFKFSILRDTVLIRPTGGTHNDYCNQRAQTVITSAGHIE